MVKRYLLILALMTIFAVNDIKSDDTIEALTKILKELNAPVDDTNEEVNRNSRAFYPRHYKHDEVNRNSRVYYPRHYKHVKAKHGRGAPNLMNVQTMNLFLKPNKRQRDEADVQKFLRTDAENICKATGRCGCSGVRCGNNREHKLADEIDRVVNAITNLSKYKKESVNLDHEREEINMDEIIKRDDAENYRNRDSDYDDRQRPRDNEDRINNVDRYDDDEIKHERHDDDDNHERDKVEEDEKHKLDSDDLLKRIKVNDNLDVVILDKSDLDVLLRNEDFIDLTRKDVDEDDNDKEIVDKVIREFKKLVAGKGESISYRSTDVITAQDFFRYYETIKQQEVAQVIGYVKNRKPSILKNFKYLTPYQRSKLRSIKLKYKRGELPDDALEEEIVKIIFGDIKIVVQNENNNKIYAPQWFYTKVLNSKRNLKNNLRIENAQKRRILPLTLQQKERLNNKEKAKTIPKLVWRKNAGQDVLRYGVPFDFEVHGLSQVAP